MKIDLDKEIKPSLKISNIRQTQGEIIILIYVLNKKLLRDQVLTFDRARHNLS